MHAVDAHPAVCAQMHASNRSPNPRHRAIQVHISSLALLKMLKHGRAGVPMEVRGAPRAEQHSRHPELSSDHSFDPFIHTAPNPTSIFPVVQVMGLMLGNFVDDYTVNCIDVFAMPQSGTSVTVEAVDPVFQHKMLEMLKQTGRWVWVNMTSRRPSINHACDRPR